MSRTKEEDARRKRVAREKLRQDREAQRASALSAEEWQDRQQRETADRILAAMERTEAEHAGMSIPEWRALSEHEQIRRTENAEDFRFAAPQHLTVSEYRARRREQFEAGCFRPEVGLPMWLRSEYARETG